MANQTLFERFEELIKNYYKNADESLILSVDKDNHIDFMRYLINRLEAKRLEVSMMQRSPEPVEPAEIEGHQHIYYLLMKAANIHQSVSGVSMYTTPLPPPPPPPPPVETEVDMDISANLGSSGKRQREGDDSFTLVPKRLTFRPKTKPSLEEKSSNISISEMPLVENSSEQSQAPATQKQKKPPPFFIVPPVQWKLLLDQIKTAAPSAHAQMKNRFARVQVDTDLEYRAVQSLLMKVKDTIEFKTYVLDADKNLKYVVRGLPINTPVADIQKELETYDIPGLSVTQLYRGPSTKRALLPLFLIQFNKSPFVQERVIQITDLFGMEVTIEKFRGRKGPTQCHNCQGFYHSAAACHLLPKCVKCAERHKTADCPKPYEEPCSCANCGGDHPASFRSCPKFPKAAPSFKKLSRPSHSIVTSQPARKVDSALSFAKVAAGQVACPPTAPPKESTQNLSVPKIDTFSTTDFLEQIMVLEKNYHRSLIAKALNISLPRLTAVSSDLERIVIVYGSLAELSP